MQMKEYQAAIQAVAMRQSKEARQLAAQARIQNRIAAGHVGYLRRVREAQPEVIAILRAGAPHCQAQYTDGGCDEPAITHCKDCGRALCSDCTSWHDC